MSDENQIIEPTSMTKYQIHGEPEAATFVTDANYMAKIEALKTAEVGQVIDAGYKEFNVPGVKVRCVYLGMTRAKKSEFNDATKQLEVREFDSARFADTGGTWGNAGKVLVDAVRSLPPHTPIEIEYIGEKANTTSKGKTKMFKVHLLKADNLVSTGNGNRQMDATSLEKAVAFFALFKADGYVIVDARDGKEPTIGQLNQFNNGYVKLTSEVLAIGYDGVGEAALKKNTPAEKLEYVATLIKTLKEHYETESTIPF